MTLFKCENRPQFVKLPIQIAPHVLPGIWINIQIISPWCNFDQDDNEPSQLHLGGEVPFSLASRIKKPEGEKGSCTEDRA
jgi:hypothetical protein